MMEKLMLSIKSFCSFKYGDTKGKTNKIT